MSDRRKEQQYRIALQQIESLLQDLQDPIAAMASVAAVLFANLPAVSWAGFYRVVEPGLLRIGPYQGPVGCHEITFDQGVCGAAAREKRMQIVPDVHSFPGHIACDPESRSEIVVPVFAPKGELVAVLDLDSHQPAGFDQEDGRHLQQVAARLSECFPDNGAMV